MGRAQDPIFICAGEPSGDAYAASFIDTLIRAYPHRDVYGVGGDEMRRAGVNVLLDYQDMMTYGFSSVMASSGGNLASLRLISRYIVKCRPQIFIAVAYPGVNLLLCRYAKKIGMQVWYFMPPQIWAWGTFRRYFIKRWVDKIYSVFPFEVEFYKKNKIEATLIENPLLSKLKEYKRKEFSKRIGFMPGSRSSQIMRNMPVMVQVMVDFQTMNHRYETDLVLHADELSAQVRPFLISLPQPVKIIARDRYQAMKDCDVLVVSSGTASLEAAYLDIPQVFIYRPSWIDYYIFRRFIKVKEYNLANLVFGDSRVPVCVSPHIGTLVSFVRKRLSTLPIYH